MSCSSQRQSSKHWRLCTKLWLMLDSPQNSSQWVLFNFPRAGVLKIWPTHTIYIFLSLLVSPALENMLCVMVAHSVSISCSVKMCYLPASAFMSVVVHLYGVKTVSNLPTNARERSTLAHTIHKCTRRIHMHSQNPQIHMRDPQDLKKNDWNIDIIILPLATCMHVNKAEQM